MWCVPADRVCRAAGSYTTMSASEPTAIVPFRGYRPNILAGVVEQVHPVLNAGYPVGDLREVAPAEFLLLLEAERAVVGRHDRKIIGPEAAPQGRAMVGGAQRRRADELRALEVRPRQVIQRQVEVLRAGFGEDVLAGVARLGNGP